jgi:hypothetical protein
VTTKQKARLRTRWFVSSAALVIIPTLTIAFSTIATGAQGKSPANPWARLTPQEKQRVVDETHAQNVKFLNDFQTRGGDAHNLPAIKISAWRTPPKSIGAAAAQAEFIMHGRVLSVHFVANPSGGIPQMTAFVQIVDVGKGSIAGTSIVLRQVGGPVSQPGGRGGLVRLDGEELALPGDEVVLFLNRSNAPLPEFVAVYGAGIQFVKNGRMFGETAQRYGVVSRNFAELWKTLTDPRLEGGAFPLQGSAD